MSEQSEQSEQPEKIGELVYRRNPDFPYPFPVERPPHYWMTEQTGRLAVAIEAYLDGEPVTPPAMELIRQYLRQYVERALLTGDANRGELLRSVAAVRTARDLERLSDELAEYGIEPL